MSGVAHLLNDLMKAGKIHEHALTVNGRTMGDNCRDATIEVAETADPTVSWDEIWDLIGRFYDPDDGAILIDGRDLRTLEPRTVRASQSQMAEVIFPNDANPLGFILGGIIVFGDPMPGTALGIAVQAIAFVLVVTASALTPARAVRQCKVLATASTRFVMTDSLSA